MKLLVSFCVFVHICLCSAEERTRRAATHKPNIVMILADDMGFGDLSSFGHHVQEEGFIDHLVAKSMKMTQFYSGDSMCTPARASLMTGRLPIRTGMVGGYRVIVNTDAGGLPDKENTIPELMKKNGYSTGMVGKWHLGINAVNHSDGTHLPRHHGFDFVGYNLPFSNAWQCDELGLFPLTARVKSTPELSSCFLYLDEKIVQQPYYKNDLSNRLLDGFKEFVDSAQEPFFFYFAAPHVHTALWAMDEFFGKSKRGIFGDNLNELHWVVSQIIGKLEDKGIDKNTLVMFSADHGPHKEVCTYAGVTGGLVGGKSNSFEGGFRVPTFAYWPGVIEPGSVSTDVFSSMDLIQTFVDLAGGMMPTDRQYDGVSFKEVLLKPGTQFNAVDGERPIHFWCNKKLMAIRLGAYKAHFKTQQYFTTADKAIYCPGGKPLKDFYISGYCDDAHASTEPITTHDPPLIFNINHDPHEKYPLNATTLSNYDDILESMRQEYVRHMTSIKSVPDALGHFTNGNTLIPCCSGNEDDCECNYPGKYP